LFISISTYTVLSVLPYCATSPFILAHLILIGLYWHWKGVNLLTRQPIWFAVWSSLYSCCWVLNGLICWCNSRIFSRGSFSTPYFYI
jgi:hypothetical protein